MSRLALRIVVFVAVVITAQAWLLAQQQKAQPTKTAVADTSIINLNTATAEQLDTLPGIGLKVAARIIEYRQKNGPFKTIEAVMNVKGIGEKNFLRIKNRLTVGTAKPTAQNQQ